MEAKLIMTDAPTTDGESGRVLSKLPDGWYGPSVYLSDFSHAGTCLAQRIDALLEAVKQSTTSTVFSGVIRKVSLFLEEYTDDDIEASPVAQLFKSALKLRHIQILNAVLSPRLVSTIAASLRNNLQMTTLILSSCNLDPYGVGLVSAALENNVTLQELDLSLNEIQRDGAQAIGNMLSSNCGLTRVVLFSTLLDGHGLVYILNGLLRNPHSALESLDLSCNPIYEFSVSNSAFTQLFTVLPRLRYLYLRDVVVEPPGCVDVSRALLSNDTLRYVEMPYFADPGFPSFCFSAMLLRSAQLNHICWRSGTHVLGNLALDIRFGTSLQSFDIGGYYLGAVGCALLSSSFRYGNSILNLNLLSCALGDLGATTLASSLKQLPHLRRLSLGDNSIGDVGAHAISRNLHYCTLLESLDIRRNRFLSVGMLAIGKALVQSNLIHLFIADNDLSGSLGLNECNFFSLEASCIENLDISNCSLGDEGLALLCRSFSHSTTLKSISIDNNGLSSTSFQHLVSLSLDLASLHVLSISEARLEFSKGIPGFIKDVSGSSIHCIKYSRKVEPIVLFKQKLACTRDYMMILFHSFLDQKSDSGLFDINVVKEIWEYFGGEDCCSSMRLADAPTSPDPFLP